MVVSAPGADPGAARIAVLGPRSAQRARSVLGLLVAFCDTHGIEARHRLDPDVIEAFCRQGLAGRSSATRGTYRSVLRILGDASDGGRRCTNVEWVAPPLVLRAPAIFDFEVRESIGGTEFGVISFPRLASTDLRILDGQHRILGIHQAIQGIADDLEKARSALGAARRNGEEPAVVQQHQDTIDSLTRQRERFDLERTSLQIFIEDDQIAYKQMFFDIADNALGITSSVRARFDSRKVVNLVGPLPSHPTGLQATARIVVDTRAIRANPCSGT